MTKHIRAIAAVAIAATAMALGGSSDAWARTAAGSGSQKAWTDCSSDNTERNITGCTRALASPSLSNRDRAGAAAIGHSPTTTRTISSTPSLTIRPRSSSTRRMAKPTAGSSMYRRMDELERAMADCEQALRINPRDSSAYGDRGAIFSRERRPRPRPGGLEQGNQPRSRRAGQLRATRRRLSREGRHRPRHDGFRHRDQARRERQAGAHLYPRAPWQRLRAQGRSRSRSRRLSRGAVRAAARLGGQGRPADGARASRGAGQVLGGGLGGAVGGGNPPHAPPPVHHPLRPSLLLPRSSPLLRLPSRRRSSRALRLPS